MAHLWMLGDADDWTVLPLDGAAFALGDARPRRVPDLLSLARHESSLALRRVDDPAGALWALMAGPGARVLVNGAPAALGLVVLADRDEVRTTRGATLFFSTETRASIEPFPDSGPRGSCPRCHQAIASGDAAVRCPSCGLWHHATADLPCWTYDPRCANPLCAQDTALDAGFRWTPDEL